ncbi:hypothetical protein DMENIID0001_055290 [Sergentomyia squamirostris]
MNACSFWFVSLIVSGVFFGLSTEQQTNPLTEAHRELRLIVLNQNLALGAIRSYISFFTQDTTDSMMTLVTTEIEKYQKRFGPEPLNEAQAEHLRSCTEEYTRQLDSINDRIFTELEKAQEEADVFILAVMQELGTFDIIRDHERFLDHIVQIGAEFNTRFNQVVYPRISEVITDLEHASRTLPVGLDLCIWAGP